MTRSHDAPFHHEEVPLTWILACASLTGVVLNIRKNRACWPLWVGTNSTWAAVDFAAGLPAQGCLMLVYTGMAVWGWVAWRPSA